MNEFPRRIDVLRMTPEELAVREVTLMVERMEGHPLLTEAVVLLCQAQAKIADYVDREKN